MIIRTATVVVPAALAAASALNAATADLIFDEGEVGSYVDYDVSAVRQASLNAYLLLKDEEEENEDELQRARELNDPYAIYAAREEMKALLGATPADYMCEFGYRPEDYDEEFVMTELRLW